MTDERGTDRDKAMLERLWDGQADLKRAAAAEGMSLWDLAGWARKRVNKEKAAGLREWADVATQLTLSRHRGSAVWRLLEIANKEEGETARKACVDAIRLCIVAAERPSPPSGSRTREERMIDRCTDQEVDQIFKKFHMGALREIAMLDEQSGESR